MSSEKPPAAQSGDPDAPSEPIDELSEPGKEPSEPGKEPSEPIEEPSAEPIEEPSEPESDAASPQSDGTPDDAPEPSSPDSAPPDSYLDQLDLDDVDVRDLLRSALAEPQRRKPTAKVVQGVQRRIREGSKGKYFGDGWSTTPHPKATFLVTSALMLLIVVLAWLLLAPYGIH